MWKFSTFGLVLSLVAQNGWAESFDRALSHVKPPQTKDKFVRLVEKFGYPIEAHRIVTEDGYFLTVHRIPGRYGDSPALKKPAVILIHGLAASAILFPARGPNNSLSFALVDAGYDVWHLNIRGTSFSRGHVNLTMYQEKYWDFSFHENAIYDLPATIDYILHLTGLKKLGVVGHSMGAVINLAMLSVRPEYNEKVTACINLAPPVLFSNSIPGVNWALLMRYADFIQFGSTLIGANSVILDGFPLFRELAIWYCGLNVVGEICSDFSFWVLPYPDLELFDLAAFLTLMRYYPDGTSVATLMHYRQLVRNGTFGYYDLTAEENYARYGQRKAPLYPLEKISTLVVLYYGMNDGLILESDIIALEGMMPNAIRKKVPHPKFNHMDFLIAKGVKELVYDDVLMVLNNATQQDIQSSV